MSKNKLAHFKRPICSDSERFIRKTPSAKKSKFLRAAASRRSWVVADFSARFFPNNDEPLPEKFFRLKIQGRQDFELGPDQPAIRIARGPDEVLPVSGRSSDGNADLSTFSGQTILVGIRDVEFLDQVMPIFLCLPSRTLTDKFKG